MFSTPQRKLKMNKYLQHLNEENFQKEIATKAEDYDVQYSEKRKYEKECSMYPEKIK